jgi:N-acetyl sugar amidotransferase
MSQICTKCLYTASHPLGITFDDHGVCSGCRVHEEKYKIDWNDRSNELSTLLNQFKSSQNYDCIIPVTGSGDSFFIVHQVKNIFGMNPLLVNYNNHFNTSTGIRNLARMKQVFDCDLMTFTVNPNTVRKVTRETLLQKGSIYWQSIAGQTAFPVQIACNMKIPLIVWGAHQGVDQVGMFRHDNRVEMSRKYRHEHDLMGLEAEDLKGGFENLNDAELAPFTYPSDSQIASVGVRGIYLNNYLFWNSRLQQEKMIKTYGYESRVQTRTFDSYSNSSCWIYSDLHDYIKLIKHGYGKVVDHACREIRLGQMTRSEATKLVETFVLKKPVNQEKFFEWFGITASGFDYLINQFRNKTYWELDNNLNWTFKNPYADVNLHPQGILSNVFQPYLESPRRESPDPEDKYITIGKGTT